MDGTAARPGGSAGGVTARLLVASAGFLLAVLWIDLTFDIQALGSAGEVPEPALASIAAYYHRVTTTSWPMGAAIGAVMMLAGGCALVQVVRAPSRRHAVVLLLALVPVALALLRVFPNAVRLGLRGDPPADQVALARAIGREHLVCLAAIAALLVLQVRGRPRTRMARARPGRRAAPR